MDSVGLFPGIEELSPEMQQAIEDVAEQTGIAIRRRCCMPEAATGNVCGWRHKPVKASIQGSLPGLTAQQTSDTYKRALQIWNQSCNVGLQWVDDIGNANIWAKCLKIDGASGTLAWSYLVQCGGSTVNTRLEQRYDTSEKWTVDWFLEVCLHELGHALGLNHINNKNALMNPYSAGGRILAPTKYELDIVIRLYGAPVPTAPDPGVPNVIGGMLFVDDGTSVAVDGTGFDYAGRRFKLQVSQ